MCLGVFPLCCILVGYIAHSVHCCCRPGLVPVCVCALLCPNTRQWYADNREPSAAASASCPPNRTLEKTGGGATLTTTPDKELTIPFTITATQTLATSVGYVAGSVSVQNVAGAITITAVSVDAGAGARQLALTDCTATQLAVGGSASCAFNVSAPNAPAAGSVTATVQYTPTGGGTATPMTSAATPYAFSSK